MAKKKSADFGVDDLFGPRHVGTSFTDDDDQDFQERVYKKAKEDHRLQKIKVDRIDEDPDNRSIYGQDYLTDEFAENIKADGFRGAVVIYPSKTDKGRYVLEAGHRTREAAVKAGLDTIEAIIVDAPEDEIVRRKRLNHSNANNRRLTPMMWARKVQYELETCRLEDEKNEREGLPKDIAPMDRVAKRLGIAKSTVSKYNALTGLIPQLQELCDGGDVSWTALYKASTLRETQQEQVFARIKAREKVHGIDGITKEWLLNEIAEYEYIKEDTDQNKKYDFSDILEKIEQESVEVPSVKRKRRTDGAKTIYKCSEMLKEGLGENAFIKPKAKQNVLNELKNIRALIDEKIKELEK